MKKKKALIALSVHLLLSVLASFDWRFLDGGYLGFLPTFALIYLLTLPVLVALLAIGRAIGAMKAKTGGLTELLCGVLGTAVCMIYVLSALGVLAGTSLLPLAYFIVFGGTAAILLLLLFLRFRKG